MSHPHRPVFVLRLSRGIVAFAVCGLFALALFATPAHASYEWLGAVNGEFGASGEGIFGVGASGIAVDDATGDVYVANSFTPRVTEFDPEGKFLGALGWNVTATGPDKAGVDQVEGLTVRASAGKFKLEYLGGKTGELDFNVSAHEMEEALDGLATIGGVGGAIKVSGGPGDATGSKPYILTFEGALGDNEEGSISSIEENGLSGGSPSSAVERELVTEGVSAFESCVLANGDICRQQNRSHGEGVGQFNHPSGVAVDNSCALHVPMLTEVTTPSCKEFDPFDGDVYVLDNQRQKGVVQVFTSEGAFVTSFGEKVGPGPVGPSPEKIHVLSTGIAVGPAGEVYIDDSAPRAKDTLTVVEVAESRVMVFKPNGLGYEYAGRSHDIAVGYGPENVAVDAAGNVYITDEDGIKNGHVFMFAAGEPTTPACESEAEYRLASLAVNPLTGQSFVHIEHPQGFHQLGPCDAQTKSLRETASFPAIAKEEEAVALAFNPVPTF
jgi:DNA-binding beta-propeller fold protein YncE